MQTVKHNGADVSYNVQKLARKEGDPRFLFRVSFGGQGPARHVDVSVDDFVWPPGKDGEPRPAEQLLACNAHRAAMPAKALLLALDVAYPGSASELPAPKAKK